MGFNLGRLRGGSGQPLLNQNIINSVQISTPPINDQKAIAHIHHKSKERFDIAFNEVSSRFEKVFPIYA